MENIEVTLANDTQGIGSAGQRVTLSVTPADMHSAEEIDTYLAGYNPGTYRADEVSPVIPVDNQTDKYRTFDKDDAFKNVAQKGSTNAPIPEVDPKSALVTFKTEPRVISSFVPKNLSNRYDAKMVAARRCKRAIALDREIEVMTLVGTNTNWDSTVRTALSSTYNWNGGENSDPVADVFTAIEKSAQPVTDMWMNTKVAHLFIKHAAVRNHMRQFLGDSTISGIAASVAESQAGPADFAIPGLPKIHVSSAKYNSSGTLTYILGNVVVLLSKPAGVPTDGEEVASTYTFQYKGPSGTGYTSREWVVEGRGAYGGDMIAVTEEDDARMTSTIAGGIITGVVQ